MSKRLLWLDCCCRQEDSRTNYLAERYAARYQGWEVERLRLFEMDLRPMGRAEIELRDEVLARGEWGHPVLRWARAVKEADEILVAAPYWDLSFPSALKVFLEWASACGVTFTSTAQGMKGLCKAGRAVYISTAGGPAGENLGWRYVRALFEMFGIPKTDCILAEGLDIWGADVEGILQAAEEKF